MKKLLKQALLLIGVCAFSIAVASLVACNEKIATDNSTGNKPTQSSSNGSSSTDSSTANKPTQSSSDGSSSTDSSMENLKTESLGLEYVLNKDNNSYSVVSVGTCQDTDIVIPSKYEDKPVTVIWANAFNGYTSLKSITIPESVTSIGEDAFYDTAYYNNEENWENGVLYIGTHLIRAKTSINGTYTIKDGTKCIASSAFYECDNLKSITMPESVTTMGSGVFWKCKKLENVVLSSNLTSIESWTFYQCDILSNIIIPDSVTLIGTSAFESCKKLETVQIGNSVTTIGGKAFRECNSLISIEIPNSVESIGSEAFWNCYNLARIDIGSGLRSIVGEVFYNCIALKGVYITDIVAWCNISFRGSSCNPLSCTTNLYLNNELITQLIIPETVTMINAYVFFNCRTITSVIIPSSVKFIEHDAFLHCSNLTSVYYEGTTEDWEKMEVGIMNQPLMNATRYYYSDTEPTLNDDGTAYEDNYWHYIDGIPSIWKL